MRLKPIEAKNQVRLGSGRCLRLALTGMSYRLFRSGITIAILALAVAFLVHMMAYGLIGHQTERTAAAALDQTRSLGELMTRLNAPDTQAQVVSAMAGKNEDRLAEYRRWAGVTPPVFAAARQSAQQLAQVRQYLAGLSASLRISLMGEQEPTELFEHPHEQGNFQHFATKLKELHLQPPLGNLATVRTLMHDGRPALLAVAQRIEAGHRRAIATLARDYPGRSPSDLLAQPPADLVAQLHAAGFSINADRLPALSAYASRFEQVATIKHAVLQQPVRAAIARQTGIAPGKVTFDGMMDQSRSLDTATWFNGVLVDAGVKRIAPEQLVALAKFETQQARLREVVDNAPPGSATLLGLPERTLWLIGLSFLVCVVGVANAMLMSVTERFTEIATMKCLGAMDWFVMMMFVFEAVIQGVIGGVIGIVLGLVLALLRGLVDYGTLLGAASSATGEIAIATLIALIVGVALAAVAAIGPSWVAARLAPMEAMRVD